MLKEGVKVTPEWRQQMADFLSTKIETEDKIELQALNEMHLYSPKDIADSDGYGNIRQIYLFSAAALLILVIAIINYINTSIARSLSRMKEVGVRKVTGASKRRLIERFLFESFLLSFISVFLALVMVKLLFPIFSEIMGYKNSLEFDEYTIIITLAVCLLTTILSGGYAAFYLSSFSPTEVFRGGNKRGHKEHISKLLIGLQFFLSISILICAVFIYKQTRSIFNDETGVDRKNIIILETGLWYNVDDFIQELKKGNPNVIYATIASGAPYNVSWGYSGISWEGSKEEVKRVGISHIFCDSHYANTFQLKLLEGEFIPPGLNWWQNSDDKSLNIVINESFKRLMEEENPIGITVSYGWGMKGKIIGVVKDFNFKPLREKITPLILSFNPEASSCVFIKTSGKDMPKTLEYILAKYKEMKPDYANRPIEYRTVEEDYRRMYAPELRTLKILTFFSIISFLLSLLGVVSMVSFMVERRTKEIAIRKINGASIIDIIRIFLFGIAKIALLATVVAIPICYLILHRWLQGYIYRTSLTWWLFLLIPLLLLLVTSIVVAIQLFFSARQNPVEGLRRE